MANSDSTKYAADQNRESYADDAKARRVLLVDENGNVVDAASHVETSAYASSLIGSAVAASCIEVRGFNSGAAQWIQVHDAAALPADTAVPISIIYAESNDNFFISYPNGKDFANGIVACNSSTGPTKTIGAADCWFEIDYI